MTDVRRQSYRYQRTIGQSATVQGVGLLTGAKVRLRFVPAPPDAGVAFIRTDLRPHAQVPARIDQVTGTQRRTSLGRSPEQVTLVEHVLAALAGLRIDNCRIEVNAPEPPGLDGSAMAFVEALQQAGAVLQPARRAVWTVCQPTIVRHLETSLALYPLAGDELRISYRLDYGASSPIPTQLYSLSVTPDCFAKELANCRTFILEEEADELRRQGLGARTTPADLLVFGPKGPIDNTLRYADEPARHKILDIIGDLSLFGHDLRGHIVACRSGHALNVEFVRVLTQNLRADISPRRCAA